jgi:hypothetical protein
MAFRASPDNPNRYPMNLENQGDDFSFDVAGDEATNNLFLRFATGKTDLSSPDDNTDTPSKTDTPQKEPAKSAAPSDTTVDTVIDDEDKRSKLEEMINASFKGETKEEDDKPAGEPGADKGEADKENKGTTDSDENAISVVFNEFKEKGLFDLPEGFEFDGTEEGLQEALQLTVDNKLATAVDETIETAFAKRPEQTQTAKDFIAFLGAGGKVADFVTSYSDTGVKVEDLDADDEAARIAAAEKVQRAYYKEVNGWSDDRIKRHLDRGKTKGDVFVDEAKDLLEEYNTHKEAQRKELVETAKRTDAATKERIRNFNTQLAETVTKDEEIAGQKLSKKERQDLHDYMFKPTADLNGKKVPQFQIDRQGLFSDPKLMAAQAMLLMKGMKPDTTATVTKVTSSLEKKLSNLQKGKANSTASGHGTEKTNRSTPGILDLDNLEVISM